MPRCSSVSRIATAFCSYQRQHQRQRQVVHAALERVGQRHGDLDRRVGVVALADVQQPRDAADVAEVELVEAVLAAGQRQDHAVVGHLLGELGVVVAARLGAVAAADQEEVPDLRRP